MEEAFELVDALQAQDPDDPPTDDARDRGARRPAVPRRVPRRDRRAGRALLDRRHRRRRPRQARAPSPARVRRRRRRGRRRPCEATGTRSSAPRSSATSIFDGVPTSQPALAYAQQLRRKAAKVGFDWDDVDRHADQTSRGARRAARGPVGERRRRRSPTSSATCCSRVVNVARHLGVDAELALRARRPASSAAASQASRRSPPSAASTSAPPTWPRSTRLWDEVKAAERAGSRGGEAAARRPGRSPQHRAAAVRRRSRGLGRCRRARRARAAPPRRAPGRGRRRPRPRLVRRQGAARPPRAARVPAAARPGRGPTPDGVVVAAVTERTGGRDGLLVTRHLDYSLPYRSLLSGRGLAIPYLGERLLDALVGLLVRLHLVGFFWGDCSLSNTLFRRDAGALSAYIIDVETSERHDALTDGQRAFDLQIAAENVAGGLLDLQAGGRLVRRHRPVGDRHQHRGPLRGRCGRSSPAPRSSSSTRRGGSSSASSGSTTSASTSPRWSWSPTRSGTGCEVVPRVVESGYHQDRLMSLTGLWAGENQARRLLNDIRSFGAERPRPAGRHARRRTSPPCAGSTSASSRRSPPIPPELMGKLQEAEIYHQLLEHRWFLSERDGRDVPMEEAIDVVHRRRPRPRARRAAAHRRHGRAAARRHRPGVATASDRQRASAGRQSSGTLASRE